MQEKWNLRLIPHCSDFWFDWYGIGVFIWREQVRMHFKACSRTYSF